MLCGGMDGTGIGGRMETCVCMAESLCCSLETTTTLLITCTKKKKKFFSKTMSIHKEGDQFVRSFIKTIK